MHSLEVFKPSIEKIITSVSHIFDVDAAVIDQQGKLVVSTDRYLKYKGQSVHVPSIEEVLTNGQYLVDKPGYMDTCSGCRFNTHCPAKMEILNCINLENHAIGVVALTSFTKEGQNRLSKRLDKYQLILQEVTEIIVAIVKQKRQIPSSHYSYQMLEDTRHASHLTTRPVTIPDRIPSYDSMKGTSQAIVEIKHKIDRIKNSTSTVLITGETGTGKGHLAKAIHETSNRATFPFVSVNCASIPENLFESELFGYDEGAFTGAKKGGKPGKFECAEGGTLFLDEIGDMPLQMQPKLLQVLQESTIERVGATRSNPINVRIIAATNHDLEEMVAQKKFRADLYYRLHVIPLTVPPLRERKSDIEELALALLQKGRVKAGREIFGFSLEAIAALQAYSWPGNIRELENVVEYALHMETKDEISVHSLPDRFLKHKVYHDQAMIVSLTDVQAETIRAALNKHGYDGKGKAEASKELGIGIRTLYRKLKEHNIKGPTW
ncbi:sigma-54 interaction domain-containing protein [Brevibacillus ginsengisoli]|uniref:sigma-54 interaction domain-containing protein n=1 Tax=Brevibacillus ginsengisoli TaxID=363854 RepID=UPI003CED05C7